MGWVQQISIRLDEFGGKAVAPPGNPKIWELLGNSVGEFACYRSQEILLQSDSQKPAEFSDAFWSNLLSFSGLSNVQSTEKFDFPVLQVRRKGEDADPIAMLLREVLLAQGHRIDFTISFLRQVKVELKDPGYMGEVPDSVREALESLVNLGLKSGIYDPDTEEARVLNAGPVQGWSLAVPSFSNDQSVRDALLKSSEQGVWSPMRKNFRVHEYKPRARTSESERVININGLLRRDDLPKKNPPHSHLSPLNFIVSLPRKRDSYADLQKFRFRTEQTAALFDRSPGLIHFRSQSSGPLVLDALSPLPLNRRAFAGHPIEKDAKLYFVSPWDSRNVVIERRVECWWNQVHEDPTFRGEILDGEQDWVAYILWILSRENGGWTFDKSALVHLLAVRQRRHRYQRTGLIFFRNNPASLVDLARKMGLSVHLLGSCDAGDSIKVADKGKVAFEINRSELLTSNPERDSTTDVRWDYPELKSPTYGFERVALHPDEFMRKVSFRNATEFEWIHQARLVASGDRFRSVLLRNTACAPFMAYRWTDGKKLWAEALVHKEEWLDVDPRQAGIATFDMGLRHLVSLGASPVSGTAEIWFALPTSTDRDEEGRKTAAFMLAMEGVVEAARAFDYRVETLQIQRSGESGDQAELFLNLRTSLPENSPFVVPGYRMTGEVLYTVGPRPPFMDAGSRILKYVTRVISNHVTKLSFETQRSLYEMLHELLQQGVVTSIRPVGEGGVAATMAEMSLWGGIGIQLRPSLGAIELFSGAPGRLLVGVLPQEAKAFEARLKIELMTSLGTTGGDKILGVSIDNLRAERMREGQRDE